jgi:hypothetical protein
MERWKKREAGVKGKRYIKESEREGTGWRAVPQRHHVPPYCHRHRHQLHRGPLGRDGDVIVGVVQMSEGDVLLGRVVTAR